MTFKNKFFFLFFLTVFFNFNPFVFAKEIKIIIAPIDVTSAGENKYLANSIPQILISRMNKSGEIIVSEVKSPLKDSKKQQDDFTTLMNLARANNADYLITGKVLSSGKNSNIDLFLFNASSNQPESHFNYNADNLNDLMPKLNDFSKASINLVKYIKVSDEKSSEKKDKITSADNKPVLVSPDATDSSGGDDSYRAHPDKLMRTGKAQQKIIDERKKTVIEKKQRTPEELASKPTIMTPSNSVNEKEKKPGLLSKIGINLPSEKIEAEKASEKSNLFIERQTLVANLSIPEANNTIDSAKPTLLSQTSSKSSKSFSFYLPYFDKKDTPVTRSGLPFPTPDELKPIGKTKQDDQTVLLKKNEQIKNTEKIDNKVKKESQKTVVAPTEKVTEKSPENSSKNNSVIEKADSNKNIAPSNNNISKNVDTENNKHTSKESEKTANPQWQWN